jgi:hypothetical protein
MHEKITQMLGSKAASAKAASISLDKPRTSQAQNSSAAIITNVGSFWINSSLKSKSKGCLEVQWRKRVSFHFRTIVRPFCKGWSHRLISDLGGVSLQHQARPSSIAEPCQV